MRNLLAEQKKIARHYWKNQKYSDHPKRKIQKTVNGYVAESIMDERGKKLCKS